MPEPDDFDQQLRDLTSGQAEPAKFTELSAAERARRMPGPPPAPNRMSWRNARKAKQLRKPIGGSPSSQGPQGVQGRKKKSRGGPGPAQRRSPQRPANSRRQRLINAARTVGILIGFVVLLIILHLLGFGPQ